MAAPASVTPAAARKVRSVLSDVMIELRALVDVSRNSEAFETDTLAALTEGICKRAHVRLDQCAIQLGAVPCGNYENEDGLADDEGEQNG